MPRFAGQIAIVTGAARGIGAAIARRLIAEGARVLGLDVLTGELAHLAGTLEGFEPHPADLSRQDDIERVLSNILSLHKRVDVLVNNAGIIEYGRLEQADAAHWQRLFRTNLESVFHCCRLIAPRMIEQRGGRIVNLASTEALQIEPELSAYGATKGAIISLTKGLAVDLAPHSVLVNAIAPGCIHTAMSVSSGIDETTTAAFQEWYVRRRKIPLGRPGEPHEVAALAAFLASAECSYVTGQTFIIDGGLTITF